MQFLSLGVRLVIFPFRSVVFFFFFIPFTFTGAFVFVLFFFFCRVCELQVRTHEASTDEKGNTSKVMINSLRIR